MACIDCGSDGCQALFERLLALEFERAEPFGRLHGVTVAAYGVQHPSRFPTRFPPEVREGQWALLQVFHIGGIEAVEHVAAGRRRANSHRSGDLPHISPATPPLPDDLSSGRLTIGHLAGPAGDFPAEGHAARVGEWVASFFDEVEQTQSSPD